jgi:hypothetical protein
VQGTPSLSSARKEQTPTITPRRPPRRHARAIWVSRSRRRHQDQDAASGKPVRGLRPDQSDSKRSPASSTPPAESAHRPEPRDVEEPRGSWHVAQAEAFTAHRRTRPTCRHVDPSDVPPSD